MSKRKETSSIFRIEPHEQGVSLGIFGKYTLLDPGMHSNILGLNDIFVFDMRPATINYRGQLQTNNFYQLDISIDGTYRVEDVIQAVREAPSNLESILLSSIEAETSKALQTQTSRENALCDRPLVQTNVQTALAAIASRYGYRVESVWVKGLELIARPPLEAGKYLLDAQAVLEPMRAGIEAEVRTIESKSRADAFRTEMAAQLEVATMGLQALNGLTLGVCEKFGPEQGANVVYALLSSMNGGGFFADRFRTLFNTQTLDQAAMSSARTLGTDPVFARYLNQMKDSLNLGIWKYSSAKDYDARVNDQYKRDPRPASG